MRCFRFGSAFGILNTCHSKVARLLAILALSPLAAAPFGQSRANDLKQATERTLANGMQVLVIEKPGSPLVAIDLWLRAGSAAEGLGEEGAAHFLEHLLFKGTATLGPGEIDEAIETLGGLLNAGTTRDGAHVYTTLPTGGFSQALAVIAGAVRAPRLDHSDMERERKVLLHEIASFEADRTQATFETLHSSLFPGHGYGRPLRGSRQAIRSATPAAVRTLYERLYRPSNTVLAIAGGIPAEAAFSAAEKFFGDWKGAAMRAEDERLPDVLARPEPALKGRGEGRSLLAIGWRLPTVPTPAERRIASILVNLLGDRHIGAIPRDLETRRAEAQIETRLIDLRGALGIAVVAEFPARSEASLRQAVENAVSDLTRMAPNAANFSYARGRVLGRYLSEMESLGGQARLLGESAVLGDTPPGQSFEHSLQAIQPKELPLFAKRLFSGENRSESRG